MPVGLGVVGVVVVGVVVVGGGVLVAVPLNAKAVVPVIPGWEKYAASAPVTSIWRPMSEGFVRSPQLARNADGTWT